MSVHTHPVATYSTRMTPRKPTDPSYGKPTWETGRSPSSSDQFPSDQSLLCTSLSRVCKIHYDLQLLFCLVIISSSTNLLTKQSSGTRKKKKKKKVTRIQELATHKLLTERHETFWESYSQLQDTQDHNIIMVVWKSECPTALFLHVYNFVAHFQQAPLWAYSCKLPSIVL